MAAASDLKSVVEDWIKSNAENVEKSSFVFVEAKMPTVLFTLGGKLVKLTVPAGTSACCRVRFLCFSLSFRQGWSVSP